MILSKKENHMATLHMSAAEYRMYVAAESQKKGPKHRNHIVYVFADGFVSNSKEDSNTHGRITDKYDSKKEYARWGQLRLLERAGKISALQKQVPFLLHEEFRSRDGVLHKAVYYKADFVYREQSGEEVVEDVKALDNATGKYLTTETFRLKWKLLMANYPDKVFRLF